MSAFEDTTPFVLALLITFTALVFISIWNNYNSVKVEKEVSKPKNDGPSRTRELLIRFTKFYNDLDAHNNYLYDTQLLPDPKQHIIHALYVGYDESENDEDRKAIKIGLEAIVQFQDLIGDEPLKPEIDEEIGDQVLINMENQDISNEQKKYLDKLELASKRDHRKLGTSLDLFYFDEFSPAMPFFLPKGTFIMNELTNYMREKYKKYDYQEVITPQIFSSKLWDLSGHSSHFQENMFFTENDENKMGIKPMNCPSHYLLFRSRLHSYKDLPIRYADFGRLHRNERSGVSHGLTRVKSFSQDDSHIFCTKDQIEAEILSFLNLLVSFQL